MSPTTAIPAASQASARFQMPEIALRRRVAEHPMVLFALAAGIAIASIALVPSNGAAFAATHDAQAQTSTPKTDRLHPIGEADLACSGQNWGGEDKECLVAISREGGRSGTIRVVVPAQNS